MLHLRVEIELLARIFDRIERVFVILSSNCRGPTPLLVRAHELFDPVVVTVNLERDCDRLFFDV